MLLFNCSNRQTAVTQQPPGHQQFVQRMAITCNFIYYPDNIFKEQLIMKSTKV